MSLETETALPRRVRPGSRPARPKEVSPGKALLHLAVVILALMWLIPLGLVLIASMKTVTEYFSGSQWVLPRDPFNLFSNLQTAWSTSGLGSGVEASLLYGVVGATLAILFGSLGAYALVRLPVRGRFFWFLLVFSGTVFPFQMYLIPLFKAYVSYGLYDTKLGMILFYTAIAVPFCLFVMRGFFSTVPPELQEAARIDGARDLLIYSRIFMPLARGPIAVLFLFQFTWIWNDLLFGLVLSASDGIRPVMPTLLGMQGVYGPTGPPVVLAAALIASLPTMALFLLLRRYMARGLTLGVTAGG
jgi:ABC-type glycerol-3-phosphate transport system permease component